jgi:hypothetical protein
MGMYPMHSPVILLSTASTALIRHAFLILTVILLAVSIVPAQSSAPLPTRISTSIPSLSLKEYGVCAMGGVHYLGDHDTRMGTNYSSITLRIALGDEDDDDADAVERRGIRKVRSRGEEV